MPTEPLSGAIEREACPECGVRLDTFNPRCPTCMEELARCAPDDMVLGYCPHGVNLDREFCPEGCRV